MTSTQFRLTLLAAPIAALVAVSLVFTAHAQATTPPCDPSVPKVVRLVAPDQVAFGRTAQFTVDTTSEGGWWLSSGNAEVTFAAADPAHPISHPFTRTVRPWTASPWEYEEMKLAHGDGVGRLEASWDQYDLYGSDTLCVHSDSQLVSPVVGEPPKAVKAEHWYGRRRDRVKFPVRPASPQHLAAMGPLTLRIRGNGRTHKKVLRDQLDKRVLQFWPNRLPNRAKLFRFKVKFGDRVLLRGRFKGKHERAFGKKIWAGTDAYWNVCINQGRKVYSQGGRLYCWRYRYPPHEKIFGLKTRSG